MARNKEMLFDRLSRVINQREIEESLRENPLYEDELSSLGYDVISKYGDDIKEMRDKGLIIERPTQSLSEFVRSNAANGYVVLASTVAQMTSEQFREVNRSGAFNRGLLIYPDVEGQVVHYNFKLRQDNGLFVDRSTGGLNMTRVRFVDLDETESQTRIGDIRDAQIMYDQAQKEIEMLLMNLDSIREGNYNTQYHSAVEVIV